MRIEVKKILAVAGIGISSFVFLSQTESTQSILSSDPPPEDSLLVVPESNATTPSDSNRVFSDRQGDPITNPTPKSPFIIEPSNINPKVELAPDLSSYNITEKIGDSLDYRPPSKMSPQEFAEFKRKQLMQDYWNEVSKTEEAVERENQELKWIVKAPGSKQPLIEIKPAGNVTLSFGGRFQRTENPAIPIRQQRNGGFDFDQQIQLNLLGNIGDRLKVTADFNTNATFDFDNNLKIAYEGKEQDWLRDIQAGNVSVPLNTQLIRGAQNLFGVKAVTQFGKVGVTAFAATQRGTTETIIVRGGAQSREFRILASDYDVDRHFFLGQYFRDVFENAYRVNPTNPNNGFIINRVEVFVTNINNNVTGLRNVVGFTDLGEARERNLQNPNAVVIDPTSGTPAVVFNAANEANNLGQLLLDTSDTGFRNPDQTIASLTSSTRLREGDDFSVISGARALDPERDFTFHPELGFISLTSRLQDDEALMVAYEYTLNGQTFTVGELREDYASFDEDNVIALKMLRPNRVDINIQSWDLMMKNIYPLNTSQVSQENFQLRVIYEDDLTGLDNPTLQVPAGTRAENRPLLQLFNMDRLNPNNDFVPDGNFDFIQEATIMPRRGQIIFPTVEPFGDYIRRDDFFDDNGNFVQNTFFSNSQGDLKDFFEYRALYDNTQSQARRETAFNKFFITGRFQSANSTTIPLSGINIAEGSVTVQAGAISLTEGVDFTVDYGSGRLTITNTGVLSSGKDIIVRFERADIFRFRAKSLLGARVEYNHNEDFNFGTTILRSNEQPNQTRVSVGDEPIQNTQIGADFSISKESRLITKLVDKLPVIQTKAPSSFSASFETAALFSGSPRALRENGTSYIDDFEGAETPHDFSRSISEWVISTTPRNLGNVDIEFEDFRVGGLNLNDHRGKLSWFNPDNSFYNSQFGAGGLDGIGDQEFHSDNQFTRGIGITEIFRGRQLTTAVNNSFINSFDLVFRPRERGHYNYNVNQNEIDPSTGYFIRPEDNWAGITRDITFDTDFENANVEFIEFWIMDPFNEDIVEALPEELQGVSPNELGGDLYFNLGEISEDVAADNRHGFENGLPENVEITPFGEVTTETFLNNAFSNTGDRNTQDVGFDGLDNTREQQFFAGRIDTLSSFVTPGAPGLVNFQNDPSTDDFEFYITDEDRDTPGDEDGRTIIERYRNFNGYEGNSPLGNSESSSTLPDNEDLNNDRTLGQSNRYFQYRFPLTPEVFNGTTNHPLVADRVTGNGVDFYQIRIPIRNPDRSIGGEPSLNSIRYMRMYLTNFRHAAILRMVNLQLVSSQWRRVQGQILAPRCAGTPPEDVNSKHTISTVNVEENSGYIPPLDRDINQNTLVQAAQNEQSLQICVDGLLPGIPSNTRTCDNGFGAFKNVAVDLINYRRLQMFIHAEENGPNSAENGQLMGFLRLGTDLENNYYEIQVPLDLSTSSGSIEEVWLANNEIDIPIEELTNTKLERNRAGASRTNPFSRQVGRYIITVQGSPDRSAVRTSMVGIKNPASNGEPLSVCVWFNELRVTDFNTSAGIAAIGNVSTQLADFGSVSGSAQYTSANYGDIESKIGERTRDRAVTYGAQTNLALHKLGADKIGIQLPFFASIDGEFVSPQFDPFDPDVELDESLDIIDEINSNDPTQISRDDYRNIVNYNRTIRSINLTNVKKVKLKQDAKSHFFDVENLSFDLGYKEERRTGADDNSSVGNAISEYLDQNYNGSANYAYTFKPSSIEPFKKIKGKSGYLKIIKDFNFSLLPSSFSARADLDRRYFKSVLFNNDFNTDGVTPNFEKSFTFRRTYNLRWNFTKSLNLTFTANADAIIDEPDGDRNGEEENSFFGQLNSASDREEYRDSVRANLRNFGRLKNYNQTASISYKLPIDKIPLFSWVNSDIRYNAGYRWQAASFGINPNIPPVFDTLPDGSFERRPSVPGPLTDNEGEELGNVLNNNQDITFNAKFNFVKLYNKSKYLKKVNSNRRPSRRRPPAKKAEDDTLPKPKINLKDNKIFKKSIRSLLLVRNLNFRYTERNTTILPGVTLNPDFFGLDLRDNGTRGLGFVTGSQNLEAIKDDFRNGGLYTESTINNSPIIQSNREELSVRGTVEPFRDFRIQLDVRRNTSTNYQEVYRFNDTTGQFEVLNPSLGGSLEQSGIYLGSTFGDRGANNTSRAFEQFVRSREFFQGALNRGINDGEPNFGVNSSDVLIPAFLAAYSGQDINSTEEVENDRDGLLRNFPRIPLPNWRLDYAGLGRIPKLRKKFSSISIKHAYQSRVEISSFQSSLGFNNVLRSNTRFDDDLNSQLDAQGIPIPTNASGEFTPGIIVNQIRITERFTPLIGVAFRTRKKINFRFDYNRSRDITLNLTNAQVTEINNQDYAIDFGFSKKNIRIPEKLLWWRAEDLVLKNELTFTSRITIRNQETIQRIIEGNQETTSGNLSIQIRPNVSYQYSKRLNMQFFFERTINEPRVSSSFRRATTAFGIRIRFNLA